MKHARFCFASLLFVVLAVGVHFGEMRNWSQSAQIRARAAKVANQTPGSNVWLVAAGTAKESP